MNKSTTHIGQARSGVNRRVLGALAMGTVLTACGGGGGSDDAPPASGGNTATPPTGGGNTTPPPAVGGNGNVPLAAPVIVQEPQDAAVREGEAARFSVELKDEREVRYQWFKNDVAVPGANEKQLVLPSAAAADDQALFRVVVTNAAGSTQSRQALLKVQALASVTGEVVPSNWSKTLPPTGGMIGSILAGSDGNFVGVGASGFVYYLSESRSALDQYKPDGTLVQKIMLPQAAGISQYIEQIAVVEDPESNDILVALGRSNVSGNFNSKLTAGGFIARCSAQSSQILFESNFITPGGLARDQNGNLYFVDLNTRALLRVGPTGANFEVLIADANYPAPTPSSGRPPVSFTFSISAWVAVAGDGTAYAKLQGGSVSNRDPILRWRNGQSDTVDVLAGLPTSNGSVSTGDGLGTYDGNVFVLIRSGKSNLIRMLNADGTVSTVAGTVDVEGPTQFGSPGVLDPRSRWLGITSDGRVHLDSGYKDTRMFYDVQLRTKK